MAQLGGPVMKFDCVVEVKEIYLEIESLGSEDDIEEVVKAQAMAGRGNRYCE